MSARNQPDNTTANTPETAGKAISRSVYGAGKAKLLKRK